MSTKNELNANTTEIVEISSLKDLIRIGKSSFDDPLDKHYVLTSDIDLSKCDENVLPIAVNLTGTFDGNGHTISNYTGKNFLFKYIGETGVLKNLTVHNFNILGIYPIGDINGYGIFAYENYGGKIEKCGVFESKIKSSMKVDDLMTIGTIARLNSGIISQCVVDSVTI